MNKSDTHARLAQRHYFSQSTSQYYRYRFCIIISKDKLQLLETTVTDKLPAVSLLLNSGAILDNIVA